MSTKRLATTVVVLLLGIVLSATLLAEHRGLHWGPAAGLCGEQGGCETVSRSAYAAPLGVPLAAVGLVFYAGLALLLGLALADPAHAPAAARLAFLLVAAALAGDVLLLGLQAFSIGAYCNLCLATYAVNALALALLWPARGHALAPLLAPAARPLAAGALASTLLAALAVAAADRALVALRPSEASLLGLPGNLSEAQARILTLQQTLDDPQKLQDYLNAKAMRDYEASPVQTVELASAALQGPGDAPLRIVTYSDFLCPFCRSLARGLHAFLPRTGGKAAVYFKHYPLDQSCNPALPRMVHPGACWLARGAVCAQDQGRFQEYHDAVFTSEIKGAPTEAEVVRLGQEAGLEPGRLKACLAQPASLARVTADIEEGRRIGVQGTPTVLVNGRKLPSLDMFGPLLERELSRLGQPLLPAPAPPEH
jgi:protein-disulfide isomerase/uncharacterized membrane protein